MNIDIKMKGCPCIRGLKQYKKTGCPGKQWDGKEGCSAWHEDLININEKEIAQRGYCIDVWGYFFLWWQQNRLAGSQQVMEQIRNGTLHEDGQLKPIPLLIDIPKGLNANSQKNLSNITSCPTNKEISYDRS